MLSPAFPPSALTTFNRTLMTGLGLLLAAHAAAAEPRTWTDTGGRTLQGTLVRQEESSVWVQRADGREVAIEKKRLSAADLEYLKSQPASAAARPATAGPAGSGGSGTVKPGQSIFKSMKLDKGAWKSSTEEFHTGGVAFTQRLETPHFLIFATAKIKPDVIAAYAEAGERAFGDCVNDLPGIAGAFKDQRMALWLVDSDPDHKALGDWLRNRGSFNLSWEQHIIAGVTLPEETSTELKAHPTSREFRTDKQSSTQQRSPVWPNRLHFLFNDMLDVYLDDIPASERAADGSSRSFNILRLGYSFYKEWQIAGKIDTEVSVGGTVVEGFQNGRRWADAVRKVLKNPAGRPSLDELLTTRTNASQPIDVACAFGMMQFFNADPKRFKAFDSLLVQSRETKTMPTTEAIAKALGYESPAAFDTAWVAFMMSDAFK